MDDTWNLSMFDAEFPYWLDELLLPVIVPDVLPLVPVGFVLVGLLVVGLVLDGFDSLDGLDDFSIVPFTSTRWFRYFDHELLLDPVSSRLLPLSELVDPLVPVGLCAVVVSPPPLDAVETSVRMNWPPAALDADELLSEPAVAAVEPVPDVPVVPIIELALFRQPVTVTLSPVVVLGDWDMLCAPSPTAIAAANTVPKKN
jgi:hypothetical protein